jgi:hypothetical protein
MAAPDPSEMMQVDDPAIVAEVIEQAGRYEKALMDNDIAVLDELFWRSEATIRYGAGEVLYGFDAIAAYRLARPGGAPPRRVRRQVVTTFGRDCATTSLEFEPLSGGRVGRQTQTWIRMPEGWRIVCAHVSFQG